MKDFHPVTLFAIVQEALGIWLWVAIAAAALVVLLYIVAFARGVRFGGAPRLIASVLGIGAGVAAIVLAPMFTQATYRDLAGLVDWGALILAGIGAGVAVFLALLPLFALLAGRRRGAAQAVPHSA
ncbi:DUF5368 family protein [Dichotomicrobium thermohalophilum]|uniref:Uncharacterized protein n=1 Tax=Dichotomicrobium thermohalophilum TaxID=933063 RepID=A0A397Q2K7_9HYPH|nr:DUF5368 family protein [Dichotomicrobium thermohalophilum]RIA55740.1 hypothetical protein BXY53_0816 [Dichotomicrobium thermohalophilum]